MSPSRARHTGVTSIDNLLPIDKDTLYVLGSVTKTVTATALMRLSPRAGLSWTGGCAGTFPICYNDRRRWPR